MVVERRVVGAGAERVDPEIAALWELHKSQRFAGQRELVRIGIDRPAAHATGKAEDWSDRELSAFATATFADLAQVRHHREVVVLDVRREEEHQDARIAGAVNIPLHELAARVDEVPPGEVWVHCAGGYRASVAASVLDAAGRTLVAIDDSFDNAEAVGLQPPTASGMRSRNTAAPITPTLSGRPVRAAYESGSAVK